MADLLDGISKKDLNIFAKDIEQIVRVTKGVDNDYKFANKKVTECLDEYEKFLKACTKKYQNIVFKSKRMIDRVKLYIFLKNEKDVKEIVVNVASKIQGIKSIGANRLGAADITQMDKFAKETEKIKDKAYISYSTDQAGATTLMLEYKKRKKMIELVFDIDDMADPRKPQFKLLAFFALKDGYKEDINIANEGMKFGFADHFSQTQKLDYLERFNPIFGE